MNRGDTRPWSASPVACPAVTSDLAGFGSYLVDKHMTEEQRVGSHIYERRGVDFHRSTDELVEYLFQFTNMERRERIDLRNKVESSSVHFDWNNLGHHYDYAHLKALHNV